MAAVVLKRPWLRDTLAGAYFPVALSAAYALLIALFFAGSEGGFDTLENVQKLFTAPLATAGTTSSVTGPGRGARVHTRALVEVISPAATPWPNPLSGVAALASPPIAASARIVRQATARRTRRD